MINALAMVSHVLEASAIAAKAVDCAAMFLENELIVCCHRVEARYHMCDPLDLLGQYGLHNLQLQMWIQVLALMAYFVLRKVFSINSPKDHDSLRLFKAFQKEGGRQAHPVGEEVAVDRLFADAFEDRGIMIELILSRSTGDHELLSSELAPI